MEKKVRHYEQILAGTLPDDTNPAQWAKKRAKSPARDICSIAILTRFFTGRSAGVIQWRKNERKYLYVLQPVRGAS